MSARRFAIVDGVSPLLAMAACDACGDDLGVHEWVATDGPTPDRAPIVDCDRSEPSR